MSSQAAFSVLMSAVGRRTFPVKCSTCKYEWIAIVDVECAGDLQCPRCLQMTGRQDAVESEVEDGALA